MDSDGLPLYQTTNSSQTMIKMSSKALPSQQASMPQVQQPTSIMPQLLGPANTVTTCQFCFASIKTAVKYTTTSRTHIAAALWGRLCCLCCIPYGSDSAKNSDHYCPNCQRYLGTYVR